MLIAALLSLLTWAPIPDPCTLIPKAEVQAFVGEPIVRTSKEDPERDEDTGGTITTCAFLSKSKMFFISVVEFASVAEATKRISTQFITERYDEATVETEPGLGDRAWFGRSARAAIVVSQKGARAFAVGIGGNVGASAAGYRAELHKFVAGVLAKAAS